MPDTAATEHPIEQPVEQSPHANMEVISFPLEFKPMKTFGPQFNSMVWAVAGAIAEINSFDVTDAQTFKYRQYTLYHELMDYFSDHAFDQFIGEAFDEQDKMKLRDHSYARRIHAQALILFYEEQVGKEYRCRLLAHHDAQSFQYEIIWLLGAADNSSTPTMSLLVHPDGHWEPVVTVRDSSDVSDGGIPLSQDDPLLASDPRVTGHPPNTAESEQFEDRWKDALTKQKATETSTLVHLYHPKRNNSDWSAVKAMHHRSCHLVVTGKDGVETLLPARDPGAGVDERSINLSVSFGSVALAPFIEIRTIVYRKARVGSDDVFRGFLRFPFKKLLRPKAASSDTEDIEYAFRQGISDFKVDPDSLDGAFIISFGYESAVASGLVPRPDVGLVNSELDLINHLRRLATPTSRVTLKLRVQLLEAEKIAKAAGCCLDYLTFLHGFHALDPLQPHYHQYLPNKDEVRAQVGAMIGIYQRLLAGSPHMRVKSHAEFMDPLEAEFQFTDHFARFVQYGKSVVALLRLKDRSNMFDPRHLLEPGTEVILKWKAPRHGDKEQSVLFFVIDDVLSFPDTDLVLVAKRKDVRYFGSDAVKPTLVARTNFHTVELNVIVNRITYRRRIDAVHEMWRLQSSFKKFWPALLNHSPYELPETRTFDLAGTDNDSVDSAIKSATHSPSKLLNNDQKEMLEGMRVLKGHIQLTQAPGGMGKTLAEVLMAWVYYQVGMCALLTAPTNAAVNVICERYAKMFPKAPQPGRGPTKHTDDNDLVDSDEVLMMELLSEAKKLHRNTRGAASNDLLSLALDAATHSRFVVKSHYTCSQDSEANKPELEGVEVDMVAELKGFYEKSQDPTQPPVQEWAEEDQRHYRQALEHVQKEVILRAPLIACTTSSSGQKIVRQNIGQRFKGLAVLIDEASRDREADTMVPLTKLSQMPLAVHLIGDINQGLPVHISNCNCNEFADRGKMSPYGHSPHPIIYT
ncbi:AAA domain-containing protein [Macrophomina phaseolina]|uniref:AAA domain-containing protein n=1 Tax=Macrophomina phaseolina TaxID=35725 RepID=A0ABQ8GSC2_9PEZI|nr:AAA domain-containing protein [Macrophomina phaseolina]